MVDRTLKTLTTGTALAPGDLFLTRLGSDTEDKSMPASTVAAFISGQGFLTSSGTDSYTTTAEVCGLIENYGYVTSALVCGMLSAYATSNFVSQTYLTKASSSAFIKPSEVSTLVCGMLSAYLTSNEASATYLTKTSSSAFLKEADVCTLLSPYLTSASAEARFLVSALTTAQVSSYDYITSQEASVLIESLAGGLTSAEVCGMLSAYITSNDASATYLTKTSSSAFAKTTELSIYLTSASLSAELAPYQRFSIINLSASRQGLLTDSGKYIRSEGTSALTWNIPTCASVAFLIGTPIYFRQATASATILISAPGGVTLNTPVSSSAITRGQNTTIMLVKVDSDIWDLAGDLRTQ